MFDKGTLLITGGTGSFGNAILDRFLFSDLREIRIFSRDEKKQDDLRKKYKNNKIKFYIIKINHLSIIITKFLIILLYCLHWPFYMF